MEEMMKALMEIGGSLKKLSEGAEQRSRALIGLTEIMEGRARELSRTWEEKVSAACEQIAQSAGSAQYLQSNAQDALQLLSRMIEELKKMDAQRRSREKSRIFLISILTASLTSVISLLIWHLSRMLL